MTPTPFMRTHDRSVIALPGWVALGATAIGLALFIVIADGPFTAGTMLLPESVLYFAAGAVGALLIFGPPLLMAGSFLFVILTGHESLSLITVSRMGAEWHLREIMLLIGLAHVSAQVLRRRFMVKDSPTHYYMALYGLFFVIALAAGLHYAQPRPVMIGEARYALFFLSYPVLLAGVRAKRDVVRMAIFSCGVLLTAALLGLGYFAYAMLTDTIGSIHNTLGAFVKRDIGGILVQSVRPNGVAFFESAAIVLVSLLFGAHLNTKRRLALMGALIIFLAAILITCMRTAYLSLMVSLLFLAFFSLPVNKRIPVALALALLGVLGLSVLLLVAPMLHPPALHLLEVSLRARLVETLGAWQLFLDHPILGAGMGASFEALGLVGQRAHMSYAHTEYHSVHNFYLYVLFKGGMVGALLVALGLGGLFVYGMRVMDRLRDDFDRAFLRGMLVAYLGQCIASIAMTRFYFPMGHAFIAFIAITVHLFSLSTNTVQAHESK